MGLVNMKKRESQKIAVLAVLIGSILCLHYFTIPGLKHYHAVYRMLFYLPLVLGSFWFGMKGAIVIFSAVSAFYLPYVLSQWHAFSLDDFDRFLEGGLYAAIALILGLLTERERKKQKALVKAERLSAMGRALAEVAHDMKTPLVAIGGFTIQVHNKLDPDDPNRRKLGVVMKETGRLENMIKTMLDFGRPMDLQTSQEDLNTLISEAVLVVQPLAMESGVSVKTDLEPDLPPYTLDAAKIEQVLLNLITNAVQASPAGEQVLVKSRLDGQGIMLEVVDRGAGISAEHSETVFHPFVSSKETGTGLGLAIVKKIVELHGGQVFFRPNQEKGVTFLVRFPLSS